MKWIVPVLTDQSKAVIGLSDLTNLSTFIQKHWLKCFAQGHNDSLYMQEPGFEPQTSRLLDDLPYYLSRCRYSNH